MNFQARDEAIPLITYNSQNRLEINEDAARILNKITQPMGVICVAGQYRTGKSYFINRVLLNRQQGFEVGSTINACTRGLWVWTNPVKVINNEGQQMQYLVIDTEGTGGLQADLTHDTLTLTLATLLSSLLIYNSVGAIDEQIIEQLGVLAGIAKNIQLKEENSDPEDLSKYFPQLLWILRDFSLQLTNSDGDAISAKEYMEKALQQQRGFSDGVEQKNRTRRLITAFFKQRDSHTLVRPTGDEYKLQNLQSMEMDALRPEFLDQVIHIRKKINQMVQVKRLKGSPLNGSAFVQLAREYVTQLNSSHRIQVDYAWENIMRDEINRATNEAYEAYETYIRDNFERKLPLLKEEIKIIYKAAKDQAYEVLNGACHGEVPQQSLKELNKRFKSRIQILQQVNEKEAQNVCQQFVNREFVSISKRMTDYRSILEFERDIKLFYQFLLEHGPKTVLKYQVYQEFYHKMMSDGAQMFIKTLNQDLSHAKVTQDEQLQACEDRMLQLKGEKDREQRELQEKVRHYERERADDQGRLKRFQDQMKDGKDEKDQQLKELRRTLEQERKFSQQLSDENRQRLQEAEHLMKQAERQLFLRESEFNKQKALLDQRALYLQKQLEDYVKKEQHQDTSFISSKSEYNQQLKDATQRFDLLSYNLQDKLSQKVDHCQALQEQLVQMEQRVEVFKQRGDQREQTLQDQLSEQLGVVQRLKLEIQDRNQQVRSYSDDLRDRYESEVQQLNELCHSLENQLREKQDKYLQVRQSIEKDKVMLQQQVEFLEVENDNLKQQMQFMKRNQDQTHQMLETSKHDHQKQSINKQILELKECHIIEIKQLEMDHETEKRKLYIQIESMSVELNESDMRYVIQQNELQKELQLMRYKVQQLEEYKAKLLKENQTHEIHKTKFTRELEDRLLTKTKLHENEVEEQRRKHNQEMKDLQQKHEEQMLQLRSVYELEKDRLERRIFQEKDNVDKRYHTTLEDQDNLHQEQQVQWEEDTQQLKDDLQNSEMALQNMSQHYQNEIELRDRQIKDLEQMNVDVKQVSIKQQQNIIQQFEYQINHLTTEKKEQTQIIDQHEKELKLKDQELNQTMQKRNQIEDMYHSRDLTYEGQRNDWQNERLQFLKKLDDLKKKSDEMQDTFLQRKMILEKNLALSQQQNQFLQSKVDELQLQLDQTTTKYELNMKVQIKEQSEDFNEKYKRMYDEKHDIQQRYDSVRYQVKDTELQATRVTSELERENTILHQQLIISDKRLNELENQYHIDISQLTLQLNQYRDSTIVDKHPLYAEIDKMKSIIMDVDAEKNEIQTLYERDQALWQSKFKFLEDQKDQAKLDLSESMIKFEQTLTYLQKARQLDRQEEENSLSDMLVVVEKKYQLQLLDLNQTHEQRLLEYDEKTRALEKELKLLQDRLALNDHGRVVQSKSFITERKVAELLESETNLKEELMLMRSQIDHQTQEFLRRLEDDKQQQRVKLNEGEERYKDLEKRRSTMIFEHEKQKAKWALERDHLQQKINELQEALTQSDKRRENITRENEKLRNDNKHKKRVNNLMGSGTTQQVSVGRRSPNKSPIETNRSYISQGYGTTFANKLSNFEIFNTNNNSFEAIQTQINFNDMEENTSFQQQQTTPNNADQPGSFETYYALMRQRKE